MLAEMKKTLPNFNFSLPESFAAEFRRIGDIAGERNKVRWGVAGAALLKLLEMPEDEMHALIREVVGARKYPEELQKLLDKAKDKRPTRKTSKAKSRLDGGAAGEISHGKVKTSGVTRTIPH